MRKLFCLFGMLLMSNMYADLKIPGIFGDNMVLQRDVPVPIWGGAESGEKVIIKFKNQEKSVITGIDGKWMIRLEPMKASSEPCELIISSSASNQQLKIKNVLVGEVWLCSGQSNMACNFGDPQNIDEKTNDIDNPQIRITDGKSWNQSYRSFSRVGYYFGLTLWKELQVPIGMINISCGCSSIETWMAPESLAANDYLIDKNGCNLLTEMKKFQQFFSRYDQCSAEEKERVFLEHCLGKYNYARRYLQNGKPNVDKYDSILWHMTVIKPTFLFNSRIIPVIPFEIRGVIWYQGETNIGDNQYALKQQILIEGWRKLWSEGDFPFYIVQIPPYGGYKMLPEFWLEQYESVRKTSNTGLISTVDIGELNQVHPRNKRDVGLRLALLALRNTYGVKDIVASGPTYKWVKIDGEKIVIAFDNTGTGLTTKNGQVPNWIEVAAADKKFVKAKAVIQDDTIVINASPVKNPIYVRYAWDCIAVPNLCNKEGLPALPFNTAEQFFQ